MGEEGILLVKRMMGNNGCEWTNENRESAFWDMCVGDVNVPGVNLK